MYAGLELLKTRQTYKQNALRYHKFCVLTSLNINFNFNFNFKSFVTTLRLTYCKLWQEIKTAFDQLMWYQHSKMWLHFPSNFGSNVVGLSARNTNIYIICKLCTAIYFRLLYKILQPNYDILLHA